MLTFKPSFLMVTAPNFYFFLPLPSLTLSTLIIAKVSLKCIAGIDLNCKHLESKESMCWLLHPLHSLGSTYGDQQQVAQIHKQMSIMQLWRKKCIFPNSLNFYSLF